MKGSLDWLIYVLLCYNQQDPPSDEQELAEEEKPNNGGPPSPLMLQLMEIGFSRTSVEMAFKTLGTYKSYFFLNNMDVIS